MYQNIEIIPEIGQAHDGSLGIAHSYIDAVAKSGAKAIKFQTHLAEAESSLFEPFRINFSYEDNTRYDYWKRMEFTKEQWIGLKTHCDRVGLEFISSPFSIEAIELLENLGVKRYKVGSGETSNLLLLEKLSRTKKPIILSSGLSTWSELDLAVEFLKKKGINCAVLQCKTAYPSKPEEWGLNIISEMQQRYNITVGYSDHSGTIYPSLFAAALGAKILEFHVVFDRKMFGPDAKASITFDELDILKSGLDMFETAMRNPSMKLPTQIDEVNKTIFEKSLCVNKDLKADHVLTFDDLESKKPKGYGIDSNQFKLVIGKRVKHDLKKWDFVNESDLQ